MMLRTALLVSASLGAAACTSASSSGGAAMDSGAAGDDAGTACTEAPLPDGGPVQVTGTVLTDVGDAQVPVPGAMVAVEYGGLYLPWCDLAHASPYYVFGAVTDDAGAFTVTAAAGKLGFHGFATGQYYSRAPLDTSRGSTVSILLSPLPAQQTKPTVAGAAFDKTTVKGGDAVTVRATVTAGVPTDPLSDETLLVEPTHSWAVELDPPSVGKKDDFPDGAWSRTFPAPAQSGTYTYWLSATTAGCVSSDLVTLQLVVQ
ncbi:MAG TPA: hypothetical protein VIF15_04305 [Polyangiaceae bacterium]|jgi:hypothetical protein